MAHNIEINNGVASYVENGRKERAWHGLGQVFDRPLTVMEALEQSHADYRVEMRQVFAVTPAIQQAMEQGNVPTDLILGGMVQGRKATMRMDRSEALGVVSDQYGVVQNADAFSFLDTLCTGGTGTPVIECAGVLGHGERVFFTAIRKDLFEYIPQRHDLFESYPDIDLTFKEEPITCRECNFEMGKPINACFLRDYNLLKEGKTPKYLQSGLVDIDTVHPTITAKYSWAAAPMPDWEAKWLSEPDIMLASTFPSDYDLGDQHAQYICGMSVPPVMMAQVASRVYEQWLSRIPE